MRFPWLLFALVPVVLLMGACDQLGGPKLDVQTFSLEHRSGHEAAGLIGPYVFGARVLRSGAVRLDPVQLRDTWSELMSTSVNITPGQTIVIGGTQARTQSDDSRSDSSLVAARLVN